MGRARDLGGVFSGRAQRELPGYKNASDLRQAIRQEQEIGEWKQNMATPYLHAKAADFRSYNRSRSFFNFFARRDTGEQHDPGGSLSRSILTKGRLERQFSVSDLG